MLEKTKIISLIGPTATGKTRLSIEIAKDLNGEIINADSMQLYDTFNIATNKPNKEEMCDVVHHLFGSLSIYEECSVAKYVKLARNIIKKMDKKKFPIVCGGTGFYVKSLLNDIFFAEQNNNEEIKKYLKHRANLHGYDYLLSELSKIDLERANKLHVNDEKRIIRSLEIYYATGRTLTEQNKLNRRTDKYNVCSIGLNYKNRETLYNKINSRVDRMISLGLEEEARKIFKKDCGNVATASCVIGYKEFLPYFKNEISLSEAVENIKKATRHYAKRQITWFLKDKSIFWIYVDECKNFEEIFYKAKKIINLKFLK
ncbi:MAG: tRNA (adenosine(37)-N6)-dimethylallyltransferase MiaA [Oscillospiraceae bacterium]|jgi:tRNA dimethylallyltransferase|nr:tRNA (adenosine(37)-N6)-dimethylallyltransferase MiaA [Oscillospiraceae bacterium]